MATKPAKTEVAVKPENELAFAQTAVPDYIKQGSARGSEEVKTSDMVLPRLEIVQGLSPIRDDSSGVYNPDAREGHVFNSVTQELYGDSVYFVPIYFRLEYLIWKDQDEGGGFFGSFPTLEQAEERKAIEVGNGENPEFLEIVDTPVHYGLRITPEGVSEQIVISMAKTKSKVSRKWNAMIQIAGGDRFARVYKISTFTDENKKGQKFKNYVVTPAGFPPKKVYEEAERLYSSFRSGEIKADHASAAPEKDAAVAGEDRGGI
jgi:hypothetical protein